MLSYKRILDLKTELQILRSCVQHKSNKNRKWGSKSASRGGIKELPDALDGSNDRNTSI